MQKPETVPCELCGDETPMTGTRRCDRCWELERRVEADPELTARVLAQFTSEVGKVAIVIALVWAVVS